jgi:hypothetical protein
MDRVRQKPIQPAKPPRPAPIRSEPTRADLECLFDDSGWILANPCGAGQVWSIGVFSLRVPAPT